MQTRKQSRSLSGGGLFQCMLTEVVSMICMSLAIHEMLQVRACCTLLKLWFIPWCESRNSRLPLRLSGMSLRGTRVFLNRMISSSVQYMELNASHVSAIQLFASRLKHLLELRLMNCPFSKKCCRKLVNNCPQLTHLILDQCSGVSQCDIQRLADCRQIKQISLRGPEYLSNPAIAPLSNCVHLHTLQMRCYHVTDASIVPLTSACKKLEILTLTGFLDITSAGIAGLASCKEMRCLKIPGVTCIVDDDIRTLASGCPRLQTFITGKCRGITDAALTALSACTQLQTLYLTGNCSDITDEGIAALVNCKQLRCLDLDLRGFAHIITRDFVGCTRVLSSMRLETHRNPEVPARVSVNGVDVGTWCKWRNVVV